MAKACVSIIILIEILVVNFVVASGAPLLGGKKLIIGVPYKSGFTEFVDVKLDPTTQQLVQVTGYSIDIFNAAVDYISSYSGFNVSFEFKPFINETGQSNGTYDNLVQQVYNNQCDAVVGDISIVASRTKYVDFTLPYAESGVRMIVRVGHGGGHRMNMWIFLKPFSWDLWFSMILVSVLIGATIQYMERNIHNDAEVERSSSPPPPPPQQHNRISVIWFPLIQLVLPQREPVAKSCSKYLLIVWLVLAYVLMQSYTASLTSILTVNQLQPSYPTLDDLKTNGENVGYATGSFVYGLLVDKLKFDKSKLKEISNIEDYKKDLDKGTRNGGVAAIFDEVPYIKVFLKKYGSKYTMAGPRFRTDGLGFAFPVNSNLTSYFSRAILNVTQNEEVMEPIGRKYFSSDDYDVEDDSDQLSSNDASSLTTLSFAGLFMITGIATVLALVVSKSHIWSKPVTLVKDCSQKLLSPRRPKPKQSDGVSTNQENGSSINEPNRIPESPSRFPNSNV